MSYSLALLLHIVGAALMFAALGVDLAVHSRMRRAATVGEVRTLSQAAGSVDRLHGISGLIILVAGIYMAWTSWGWTTPWIDVALIAYLIGAVLGAGVIGERMRAIGKGAAAAAEGPVPSELAARIHDRGLALGSGIMTLWLGGILYLMVVKPGWTGSIVAMLVAAVIGYLVARPALRAELR